MSYDSREETLKHISTVCWFGKQRNDKELAAMKAIIIEEDRFIEILDKLKYESERMANEGRTPIGDLGVSREAWKEAVRETHRVFHFNLVQWMQSHGASCIRKG